MGQQDPHNKDVTAPPEVRPEHALHAVLIQLCRVAAAVPPLAGQRQVVIARPLEAGRLEELRLRPVRQVQSRQTVIGRPDRHVERPRPVSKQGQKLELLRLARPAQVELRPDREDGQSVALQAVADPLDNRQEVLNTFCDVARPFAPSPT